MRIKEPFATERESEISDYRKKYFITSEGSATEPKYFEKLNESLIKENVTVINILRDYANQGHSNPTHVIKLLQTFIEIVLLQNYMKCIKVIIIEYRIKI